MTETAALQAELARYRAMVEHAAEGLCVAQGGYLCFANPACLALLGVESAQLGQRPLVDYLHPDDRAFALQQRERRDRGEKVAPYEVRFLQAGGRTVWVEISGVRIDWDGAPAHLFLLKDIGARRAAEHEVRKALARERELGEFKTRLLSTASHEFRTPLAAILSSAELVGHYGERMGAEEQRSVMADLVAAARRLQGLVDDMLLVGQAEADRLVFQPRLADLEALCRRVLSEQRAAQPGRRVELEVRRGGLRSVDERLVHAILSNLVTNACKYSGSESEVRLALECTAEGVQLEVRDEGIGIAPADLPHVFESFHRGSNTGHRTGSGLGLAIVRSCARAHGGEVEVESTLGRGTLFRVTLPAAAPDRP
jgi:PAS domain S-box-containing protein